MNLIGTVTKVHHLVVIGRLTHIKISLHKWTKTTVTTSAPEATIVVVVAEIEEETITKDSMNARIDSGSSKLKEAQAAAMTGSISQEKTKAVEVVKTDAESSNTRLDNQIRTNATTSKSLGRSMSPSNSSLKLRNNLPEQHKRWLNRQEKELNSRRARRRNSTPPNKNKPTALLKKLRKLPTNKRISSKNNPKIGSPPHSEPNRDSETPDTHIMISASSKVSCTR